MSLVKDNEAIRRQRIEALRAYAKNLLPTDEPRALRLDRLANLLVRRSQVTFEAPRETGSSNRSAREESQFERFRKN